MKLVKILEGNFEELKKLNTNFKADTQRIRVTIDTIHEKPYYINKFPDLLFKTLQMFPNIRHHHCHQGEQVYSNRDFDIRQLGAPIQIVGDVIDTVHLVEHISLEIQCQLDELDECSGLTCNYWEPENRFDVFIECRNPEIATFSCHLAVLLSTDILEGIESDWQVDDIIDIAKIITKTNEYSLHTLAKMLKWPKKKTLQNMKLLEQLYFPLPWLRSAA
ncbi:MAG: hypothetical protein H6696_20850 [Deferribacteres bacterium]|nr:hypothetical protein [candidate division KSB1 bacterium]MCB9504382.1 hypothetical protein [Deferribacteres bacterium]